MTGAAAADNKAPTLTPMLTHAIPDEWPDAKPFANSIRGEESHLRWLTPLVAAHRVSVQDPPRVGIRAKAGATLFE